jgi:hypothetical protein
MTFSIVRSTALRARTAGLGFAIWLALGVFTTPVTQADTCAPAGEGLTPIGAEQAGNADGSIPPWTGGLPQDAGTVQNGFRSDPFYLEKPLLVITAQNYQEHESHLTPGQVAMLKRFPATYSLPVYPTHRSVGIPEYLCAAISYNAKHAHLISQGRGVGDLKGAVPFPTPHNGLEVIWNHVARYRGANGRRETSTIVPQADGSYAPIDLIEYFAQASTLKGRGEVEPEGFFYKSIITSPKRLSGNALLIHESPSLVSEARSAWLYNAGQRRLRRAPQYAYDGSGQSMQGLKTADGLEIFNGSPDRYNWELVGKREIYVPYNSYRIASPEVSYDQLIRPGHLDPKNARYELHRVWEVVATLKPGQRHIYAKRHLFIDEDSWMILAADHYDSRGVLWRVAESHLQYFYDVQVAFPTPEVLYDLVAGRYVASGLINQRKNAYDFSYTPILQDFSPEALKQFEAH